MTSPRARRLPFPWWFFALVLAASAAPLAGTFGAGYIANAVGCESAGDHYLPCRVLGFDIAPTLGLLSLGYWFALVTIPAGLVMLGILGLINFHEWDGLAAGGSRDAIEPEFGPYEVPAAFRVGSLAGRERHDPSEPYRHAQGFDRDFDLVWPWRGTRAVGRARNDVVMVGLYSAGSLMTYGMWPFALLAALAACHALRAIAHRFNRTTVLVRGGTLNITHRPLALPKRLALDTVDIESFEILERAPFSASQATFAVVARLVSGRKVTLVTGLPTARHAKWLVREISASMGLE